MQSETESYKFENILTHEVYVTQAQNVGEGLMNCVREKNWPVSAIFYLGKNKPDPQKDGE